MPLAPAGYQLKLITMEEIFDFFLEWNEELSQQYDSHILHTVFTSLTKAIDSSDSREIPLVYLLDVVKEDLARKKVSVINLEYIVRKMMDCISLFYSLEEDSFERHHAECEKLLWKVLAHYINNPADYLKSLTADILREFASSSNISAGKISAKLQRKKKYRKLPPDAIDDCIVSLFDYFVAKGHIKIM